MNDKKGSDDEKRKLEKSLSIQMYGVGDSADKDVIMKNVISEIDKEVKKLVEAFRFMLKYQLLFKGTGIEFAGLREYVPGQDDATKIDWKASLRSKSLYVKQFEEERNLYIHIVIDSSSSMFFGTQNKAKYEYANIIAGAITYAAVETGDNVGFTIFNDGIAANIEPSNDSTQYYKVLRAMINPINHMGKCNMESALLYTLNTLDSKTILFIISDFIGLDGKGWTNSLKMVSGKVDRVIGIMVRDIRDDVLPKNLGYLRVSDPFSGRMMTVNSDIARFKYERLNEEYNEMIEKEFKNSRAGFFKVYTTDTFVKQLIKYIELSEVY